MIAVEGAQPFGENFASARSVLGQVETKYDVGGQGGNATVSIPGGESYSDFEVLSGEGKFMLDTVAGGKYVFEVDWTEEEKV